MIEYAVIGLAWLCGLVALGAVLLLILDYFRDPPRWWVRRQVPDRVPDDWGGGDRGSASSDDRVLRKTVR